ncbi:uncharacterized protein LOC143915155 [Arctopsyche grandis]|uniref:uncharacterized protein LOC143915155 n=1 Tax=Arctopsyche grandis TaxID=121162 RepID=UPI00406D68B6
MECRLCLRSVTAESSVSIHDNPHPLVQRIWTFCQLQVTKSDGLPDGICLSCNSYLELLSIFRNVCRQSNQKSKLRLSECLDIKPKEVLLEDEIWEDKSNANSPTNMLGDEATLYGDKAESRHEINFEDRSKSHAEIKTHQCGVCLKTFAYRSNLLIHERSHTGEKPYKCDICLKSFSQKSHLAIHERTHTGERPFKCCICFKSFASKSDIMRHEKSHTREKLFKCDNCLDSFATKSELSTHGRSHAGLKLYNCDICLKSFARKFNLVTHERSHTGERPYLCVICCKAFITKSDLVRHERSHAGRKATQLR